jgi:DNA (cytosine-5)-methyltransferase 3A
MKKLKVLSLFDGISCARVALEKLGIDCNGSYFASEIDKYALQVSEKNFPDIKQIGDVKSLKVENGGIVWSGGGFNFSTKIDLLIGGSPCQDLSIAKTNRKGLAGERSGLFYEYLRILKEVKPKYFVLENVATMSNEARDTISELVGVQPIMIDAALVSAQSRKRYFWTNIPGITLPSDRRIMLKDIIEGGTVDREKSRTIMSSIGRTTPREYFAKNQGQMVYTAPVRIGKIAGTKGSMASRVYSIEGKSVTLSANGGGGGGKTGLYEITGAARRTRQGAKQTEVRKDGKANAMTTVQTDSMALIGKYVRKLTPKECERLQCLPDDYTSGLSDSQRYKTLGNAFNVAVVKHILSFIKI